MKKLLYLSILSFTFFSCSLGNEIKYTSNSGAVKLKFDFPKKFTLKAIPESTEKIVVKVYGEGLAQDIEKSIDRNSEKTLTIKDLPKGKKTVDIRAFDSKNNIVAKGASDVEIKAGEVQKVTIELAELLETLKLRLENIPSDAQYQVIEVVGSNKQIKVNEFSGNEIEIKDVPSGTAKVRVASFDKNLFPLAKKSTEVKVNKETQNVSLEPIKIPSISSVSESNFQPKELFDILNDFIIKSPSNSAPKVSNISVEINGKSLVNPPIFANAAPCIKSGDKIKVSLTTKDDNDDKLGVFWGVISRDPENKLSFELLPEKGNELNYTVFMNSGSFSLGFVVTDKKSFTNPSAVFFKTCN